MPPLGKDEVARLYERYGAPLYRRCLTLVGNEDDARELLQEVFCQFWMRREAFLGQSSVFTYLYRIATNLSIDRLRRRTTRGAEIPVDDHAHSLGDARQTPERRTLAMSDLVTLTEGLDEETLTVAVLAYVDGLTQDEIADTLDLSRRTIGKRLKRFAETARQRAGVTLELPEGVLADAPLPEGETS